MKSLLFFVSALLLVLTITLTTSVQNVEAWWAHGHLLLAEIAKQSVSTKTAALADFYMHWLSTVGDFPKSPDMVNGASWADDIKGWGFDLKAMSNWHFTNNPFAVPDTFPVPGCPLQEDDSAKIIPMVVAAAKHSKNNWIRSFSIAFVIHLCGDASQPLHGAELFDATYPHGDYGGNEIKPLYLPNGTKIPDLHGLWDSVCWQYPDAPHRPLSPENEKVFQQQAAGLITKWKPTISKQQAENHNATQWLLEDFAFAKNTSYLFPNNKSLVKNYDVLTPDYMAACKKVAERQLVLGGLRLAHTLEYIFEYDHMPSTTTPPTSSPPCPTLSPQTPSPSTPTPSTQSPHHNNNNQNNTPGAPADQWNSKATGGFFGGMILGIALVLIPMLVYKYTNLCGEHGGQDTYANIGGGGIVEQQQDHSGYSNLASPASPGQQQQVQFPNK